MEDTTPGGRLRGALALSPSAFRAIADDPRAIRDAVLVVIVATLLAGLGGLIWTRWGGKPPANAIYDTDVRRFIARSVIVGGAIQVGLWLALVAVTGMYLRAFGVAAPFGRLARALGYAFAPMALQFFVFPPGLELAAAAVALGFTFAAMVVAVQAAVDTTPGRALVSALAGFALFAVALSLLGNGGTDLAPGIFALDPLPTSVGLRQTR